MMKHKLSVSEALRKVESGESVSGFSIDFDRIKVEALDVMKLSKGGIVVPGKAICYDDDAIANDEDFEGDWVRVDSTTKPKTEVRITLEKDLRRWVEKNNIKLDQLLEKLLEDFYEAQKMASGGGENIALLSKGGDFPSVKRA